MDKKMRDALKKLYEAPVPERKRTFLRAMRPQPIRISYMLWVQIAYISKWEWIISSIFFGMIVLLSCTYEVMVFLAVLAVMPVLAAISVSESVRSVTYGMKELEMSARFSAKSIILAKMCVLGIENFIFACACTLLIQGRFLHIILYLLVPYLTTVYLCLFIVRNIPGSEGIYSCIGISIGISMCAIYSILNEYMWIYQDQYVYIWAAAVVILVFMNFKEGRRMIHFVECYM